MPQSEVGVDAGAYARQLMGNAAVVADESTASAPDAQVELSAQVGAWGAVRF